MSSVEMNMQPKADNYFYSLDIQYDIERLRQEINFYLDTVLKKDPDYGKFFKDDGNLDDGDFRFMAVKGDDINNLRYTNYIKCYLEDQLEIEIDKNIPITATKPFATHFPHVDGNDNMCFCFGINFPLFEEDYGSNKFWELENSSDVTYSNVYGVPIASITNNSKTLREVFDIKMDSPKLFRTEKYHSIDNSKNKDYRMNVSFRTNMKKQMPWEDILNRVKKVKWGPIYA